MTSPGRLIDKGSNLKLKKTLVVYFVIEHNGYDNAKLVTLKMGKNYGLKQFKQEVKNAMQIAGVENEQVFFLLEDHNLIDHNFLDMVNSLLSSGEIPGK